MPNVKLTRKQEQAIAALLEQPELTLAAKAVGVSPVTLWRWLQKPEFKEAYEAAKKRLVEGAINRIQAATGKALDTLLEVMGSGEKESARVSAAKTILDLAFHVAALEEIEKRLEALEEKLGGGNREAGTAYKAH
ncbi:MAG: phBC6A51 family helix-turn-helix protein [Moorellaceae bacterium]